MKRRDFIKLSFAAGSAILLPEFSYAKALDLSQIQFSSASYDANKAQTLIIFLYGGASQLAGNLTNLEEIKTHSQSDYDSYFGNITKTANNCWQEAGGRDMETLLGNGDMTIFRSCYSAVREAENNKSHGLCTLQNQLGTFDTDDAAGGVLSNLTQILEANGVVTPDTLMPFVTMEGDSKFYRQGNTPVPSYLKPVGINEDVDNPYKRDSIRRWYYYTEAERESAPDSYWKSDEEGGFDPALTAKMDQVAQQHNSPGKIKAFFKRQKTMSDFMDNVLTSTTPDLGEDAYPADNLFAKKVETAMKLLINNPDTKVLTLSTGSLGGWDDHNEARDYVERMQNLFAALKSAMAHLKAAGKEQTINIMVFCEFGRNVNLNSANGWDHGNLQNFYVLGGKGYFNHKGIVGETKLVETGEVNRLYLHPKDNTYWFEPLSIAATLYKIYGVENPDVMTDGYGVIDPLFS
jgi:hypothetical protein